jgi:hypothetical protein
MKKIKKIVATILLASILLSAVNVAHSFKKMDVCNYTFWDTSGNYYDSMCTIDGKPSEVVLKELEKNSGVLDKRVVIKEPEHNFEHKLNPSNERLYHVPFWLSKNRNRTKDEQLCKIGTSFKILDHYWDFLELYYPEGCQPETESFFDEDSEKETEKEVYETESVDEFLWDLFWDNEIEEKTPTVNAEDDEIIEEKTSDETTEEVVWDDELDEIFGDLFSLKWKKLAPTIRDFAKTKLRIQIWAIKANFIGDNKSYNKSMSILLNRVNTEFKIDSIKNDFAKNVSNLSYSLSTYETTTDLETKIVFEKKLGRDIEKLKRKYKKLKFKDIIISKTIADRV